MTAELKLTPEQTATLTAAFAECDTEITRLRKEVAKEERAAALKAAYDALSAKIKTTLTPEQQKANRALTKRHQESVKAAKAAKDGPKPSAGS